MGENNQAVNQFNTRDVDVDAEQVNITDSNVAAGRECVFRP